MDSSSGHAGQRGDVEFAISESAAAVPGTGTVCESCEPRNRTCRQSLRRDQHSWQRSLLWLAVLQAKESVSVELLILCQILQSKFFIMLKLHTRPKARYILTSGTVVTPKERQWTWSCAPLSKRTKLQRLGNVLISFYQPSRHLLNQS